MMNLRSRAPEATEADIAAGTKAHDRVSSRRLMGALAEATLDAAGFVEASLPDALAGADGRFADAATARRIAGARQLQQFVSRQWAEVTSAQNATFPRGFDYGLNDFWIGGVARFSDGTPSGIATFFRTHAAPGNLWVEGSISTTGSVVFNFYDLATNNYTITLSSTIPDNVWIRWLLTCDRDGLATFRWFSVDANEGTGSTSIAASAATDIGSGNTNKATLYNDTDTVLTHAWFDTGLGLPSTTEADAYIYEGVLTGVMSGTGSFSPAVNGAILQPTSITPLQITSATGWNATWAIEADVQPKSSLTAWDFRNLLSWAGTTTATNIRGSGDSLQANRMLLDLLLRATVTTEVNVGDESDADRYAAALPLPAGEWVKVTLLQHQWDGTNGEIIIAPTSSLTGDIDVKAKFEEVL